MDRNQRTRLGWIKLYKEQQFAGIVCRRCGISRPTLRKWLIRYQVYGVEGLKDKSRRPHYFFDCESNQPNRRPDTRLTEKK